MTGEQDLLDRIARLERLLERANDDHREECKDLKVQLAQVKGAASTLSEKFQELTRFHRGIDDAQKKALAAAASATSAADASVHRMKDIADGAIRHIDKANEARAGEQAQARTLAEAGEQKRREAQKAHAERFERLEAGSLAQAQTLLKLYTAVQASASKSRVRTIYLGAFITLVTIVTSQCNQALKTVYTAPSPHEVTK